MIAAAEVAGDDLSVAVAVDAAASGGDEDQVSPSKVPLPTPPSTRQSIF